MGNVGPVRPGDLNQLKGVTQQDGYMPWWSIRCNGTAGVRIVCDRRVELLAD